MAMNKEHSRAAEILQAVGSLVLNICLGAAILLAVVLLYNELQHFHAVHGVKP